MYDRWALKRGALFTAWLLVVIGVVVVIQWVAR